MSLSGFRTKYQIVTAKAVVQVDFPAYSLSMNTFKSYKMAKFDKHLEEFPDKPIGLVLVAILPFFASQLFLQMHNISVLCMQSIKKLH